MVGIFHPYCNAGGGGERVLWCAVRAIQSQYPNAYITVYTGDCIPADDLLQNAFQKFNVKVQNSNIEFITLTKRSWVEAARYPYFTLLGQSLGSLILGTEAIWKLVPGISLLTVIYRQHLNFWVSYFRHLSGHNGIFIHISSIPNTGWMHCSLLCTLSNYQYRYVGTSHKACSSFQQQLLHFQQPIS